MPTHSGRIFRVWIFRSAFSVYGWMLHKTTRRPGFGVGTSSTRQESSGTSSTQQSSVLSHLAVSAHMLPPRGSSVLHRPVGVAVVIALDTTEFCGRSHRGGLQLNARR